VEIVTLDSVICCYPYLEPLLAAATRSHPRLVGITYPRDVWWMRAFLRLYNLAHTIRRSSARYFFYPSARGCLRGFGNSAGVAVQVREREVAEETNRC
jgi:hypothetical protein